MPAMPRSKGKATKIAWKILGKPLNMDKKANKSNKKMDERLLYEKTSYQR